MADREQPECNDANSPSCYVSSWIIVEQHVDDVKTDGSRRSLTVANELMQRLKLWKQRTQFPAERDWIFASPFKIGRLPYSYTGVWRELQRAAEAAGVGNLGTHAFRHTYRSWRDAVGTPIAVQQKLMRHSDIRTTMNIYGDLVTDERAVASSKVAGLALKSAQWIANGLRGLASA